MDNLKQLDDLHEALASTESELRDAREALARVEAERDTALQQVLDVVERSSDDIVYLRGQLAEALGEIRIYQQKFRYIAEGGSFYLSTAAECVRLTSSFLAMHANTAQAEQQEATESEYYCKVCGNHGCVSGCHPDYYRQAEAQGAQAGDERVAFESSLDPSLSRETFVDEEGDTVYRYLWVQGAWIGWNRRAALPTRPAVRGAGHE